MEITRCDSRDSVRRLILHKAFLGIYIYIYVCIINEKFSRERKKTKLSC